MTTVVYDGSFEGFLTAVFEVYEYKLSNVQMVNRDQCQLNVFEQKHECWFDNKKSERVWKGLSAKVSKVALQRLYRAFLSEEKGIEDLILRYIQYALSNKLNIENDYSNESVIGISQIARKVDREKHRMEAFIRFQLTQDKLYYALCQPDFNVLPLIEKHFRQRYADQRWLIYDATRKYGIYYDLKTTENITLTFHEKTGNENGLALMLDENEALYQKLWKQYFTSVNIVARKNTKLHIQHMPKRYWKYLTEKQRL